MTSWDDLDSFQLNLQPAFQGVSRLNTTWQGGLQHAQQRFVSTTQFTLSLDRYLQLLQLLCGGQPNFANDAANTWTVRQLGELERAAVKMEDLRKVLALNGRAISAKNKQDMLDKMAGLQLASPIFLSAPAPARGLAVATAAIFPSATNETALIEASQKQQQQELQQAMQRALQWADISPAENTLAEAAISRQGCYSFCPLPEIKLPYSSSSTKQPELDAEENFEQPQQQQQQQQEDLLFAPQQPATSATTFASRPALPCARIAESPPPLPLRPSAAAPAAGVVLGSEEEDTEMLDVVQNQNYHHDNPSPSHLDWLIPGYKKLAAMCQGIKTIDLPCKKELQGTGTGDNTKASKIESRISLCDYLVGRKVALVMTEDFQQGGRDGGGGDGDGGNGGSTNDDIIDTVSRGIHLGQVVEWIGHEHDSDICPVGCTQHHNFCYVRVTPTETTAPEHRRGRRRLDLAVDLREEYRVDALEDLLLVGEKELADAWVLVEPKDVEEDA